MKRYTPDSYVRITKHATGDGNFISTTKPADAVFITYDDELVNRNRTQPTRAGRAVVGIAKHYKDYWHIDLGSGKSLELVDREVYVP